MSTNKYQAKEGHISRSGKTILRVAKSGRKYYHNPTKYKEKKAELEKKHQSEGFNVRGEYDTQRVKPLCYDEKSESYMRYFEKKCKIRAEYPKWVYMSREQNKEYFSRILYLLHFDEDFRYYMDVEKETIIERNKREWWEHKKRKDSEYDGHLDEYTW